MNNFQPIRGRFAPSPSGVLHLGNLSSLLLAWLDARSLGGEIIFRLEDLDPARCKKEYSVRMKNDLEYLGLDWNDYNGVCAQSERTALYDAAFERLIGKGLVYPCYCSRSKRLSFSKPHSGNDSRSPVCRCAKLTAVERQILEASGRRPAWKVAVPNRFIEFCDGHYGLQRVNLADDGDFIIKRSDGIYAYQLAVSFDDMDMGISRVVRGRDLLSSTAKQIWLVEQLGGRPPEYVHTPLIMSGERKMSKRFGDLSMETLRLRYAPEELLGIIAKLLNLRQSSVPVSPTELLSDFSWDNIPTDDIEYSPI